ncbi:MAG: bifunctional 4-hydroxy-2-oxoglutarate aldolase/2-dehydro-3-deoxy-phosphogluconate aldolase [Spirochaetes bacterium]|nr:bifunctional 4-hydroxy-2-oxoglutarate aldolase/2-dehydro-3-deoxy-phosphogluconate aldolase [Spirochaetota bacterium]
MDDILRRIGETGIVPVVKITDSKNAVPLGEALLKGELPVAEITFRTQAAEESIRKLGENVSGLLVGAGTVLTIEQVKRAAGAGAKFIVSPGFNPEVVDYCVERGIPVTPGINSPTQIEMALKRKLEVVKFFPAEASGGLPLLKAMAAPYSGLKFIPTGGINKDNILRYLNFNRVHACGGSWMVKADLISEGNFAEITHLASEAVSTVLGFSFAHLGINRNSRNDAVKTAELLSSLFSLAPKEGSSSIFAGNSFEVTKSVFPGNHGHIAVATNSIERAIAYLKRKGVSILEDTKKEKDGKFMAVYLDIDIAGFAVHLLQK